MNYLKDYQYRTRHHNFEHVYRIRGKEGAAFLWWVYPKNGAYTFGGLEFASLSPLKTYQGYPITSWAVDGQRCWVDGVSSMLYAMEELIPIAKQMQPDHEAIFEMIEKEYERFFDKALEAKN